MLPLCLSSSCSVEVLRILRSSNPPPSYTDTVAQHQDAPPTYTALQSTPSLQFTGAQMPSASASAPALTPRRASGSRQGPFQHSVVQKRGSPARRRSAEDASAPTSPAPASHSSSASSSSSASTASQEDESPDRSVRRRRQGPDGASLTAATTTGAPRSTSLLSSAPTTSPPASPSSAAWPATLSSEDANTDGEEKTEAQLSFQRWLDAPRCPRVVPQWHFQPAEGEADWLTEMLV